MTMTLEQAKEVVGTGEGVFGRKYHDACEILAREHRTDPCPPELRKTKTLKVDGVECKVYYNYVPPYSCGVRPLNVWWGYARTDQYYWSYVADVKTLEEAVDIILPLFVAVVKRWKEKQITNQKQREVVDPDG